VDIRVEITPDSRRTLRGLRYLKRRKLWTLRLAGAFCVLFGLLMVAVGMIGWAIFFFAYAVIAAPALDLILVLAVRRVARMQGDRRTIELTDERLRSSGALSTVEVAWPAVDRVSDNDEFWFLRLASRDTIILPKQHLTPAQQQEFRDFLQNRNLIPAS
jgi:membrane protein implicated in regulation of membrane protease activity